MFINIVMSDKEEEEEVQIIDFEKEKKKKKDKMKKDKKDKKDKVDDTPKGNNIFVVKSLIFLNLFFISIISFFLI